MICFKGKYYIFASMTLGVWVSEDLVSWSNHRLPGNLPLYDYAPDVRVIGDYIYFRASKSGEICNYYRTNDILEGTYEEIPGTFDFWDPHLYADENGRMYFYWGCSNITPIWGVELDPKTMQPIGEKQELISGHPFSMGYERIGVDNCEFPRAFSKTPFIEGAWMNKYQGKYYLQYACPGAGHGSTEWDYHGNLWHTGTIRISMNHQFERRVGIWPAGFDSDGELFCNQRYGDWPQAVKEGKMNPWENPKWYLLSFGKTATASSCEPDHEPSLALNEDITTWWRAVSAHKGEWLQVDLGETYDVNVIQINFADDKIDIPTPGVIRGTTQARYIEEADLITRWVLEGSIDGENYFIVEDKSEVNTDLSHDFLMREEGVQIRYLKLTIIQVPYGQKPQAPKFKVQRTNDLDIGRHRKR